MGIEIVPSRLVQVDCSGAELQSRCDIGAVASAAAAPDNAERRERGLEPLSELLWAQAPDTNPELAAAAFVDAAKEVPDAAGALAGATGLAVAFV